MFSKLSKVFLAAAAVITLAVGGIAACSGLDTAPSEALRQDSRIPVSRADARAFDLAVAKLANSHVVYLGESHGCTEHHLNQLAVIRALHETGVRFAIGAEFFQRPFQPVLNAFLRGDIGETELLASSGYHSRWGYDFRFYRPILEYARLEGIPVLALNAPSELVAEVSKFGWLGVGEAAKAELPSIRVPPSRDYRQRLLEAFAHHPPRGASGFNLFMQIQLLWDEYMAESAAEYLRDNPKRKLVVLAGSGHVRGGMGIPERLARRIPGDYAVALSGRPGEVATADADVAFLDPTDASQDLGRRSFGPGPLPEKVALRLFHVMNGEWNVKRL